MPYVVRWKLRDQDAPKESPASCAVPSQAIDVACAILKQHPREIWIEGPGGLRIERAIIVRNCRDRGMLQPSKPHYGSSASGASPNHSE